MTKNDMLDEIFTATSKLELMQTVINTLINMVEKEHNDTAEAAFYLMANQSIIGDFLHITLDGVHNSIQILDRLQKGGAE